ncbi:MAG: NAD-dependent protein deacylase [Spirochaetaceae bacterium]|jgi:NAD-dependent deacetylase|nr:NAD-dependent protein deacylase [Spirochaetaceae bacterium]
MKDKIELLRRLVENSRSIVFFGGAGVSTESGIPDFRSTDGLYSQQWAYPPETILSRTFFLRYPDEFFRFYREKLMVSGIRPNRAHEVLARLEHDGKVKAVITQNIDGLHQQAGSENVIELHGSIHRNYCMECGIFYPADYVTECGSVPRCRCGGIVKPDVVLYEESLDTSLLERSARLIRNADLLIIGGTSLSVYPAAGLIHSYNGRDIVLINKTPTGFDGQAQLLLNGSIGEILGQI